MKISNLIGTILLICVFFFTSCSKTGPMGPEGEQGEQGVQGISGADGSIIYNGNGAPVEDLGKSGDYYLDKTSSHLYGPKTSNGWGSPLNLKGNSGENGKDGTSIFSGSGGPASSVGTIGDYYWDVSGFRLYGPKASSGWGSGIVLRGPKGDKGDPGTANVMYSDLLKIKWNGGMSSSYRRMIITDATDKSKFFEEGGTLLGYLFVYRHSMPVFPQEVIDTLLQIYSLPLITNKFTTAIGPMFNFAVSYNNYDYGNGGIRFSIDILNGGGFPSGFLQDNTDYSFRFRYILIPGGMHLRLSSRPPDTKDYKAICKYYGIPK